MKIMSKSIQAATEFYSKLSARGLEKLAKKWRVNDDIRIVRKLLRRSDKVLDVGSGYGRVAIPLAKAGFEVVGIDISGNLVREARRRARKANVSVRFDIGNMVKLPYRKESFDKIISMWNVFNELLTKKEQMKALDEMFRVLRPGGMALIVTKNWGRKEIQAELKKKGTGQDRRLIKSELEGIKSITYIHDRTTLRRLCGKSKFKKCIIHFKNMNARRRLAVYLYK